MRILRFGRNTDFSSTSIFVWSAVISFVTIAAIQAIQSCMAISFGYGMVPVLCVAADALAGLVCAIFRSSSAWVFISRKIFGVSPEFGTISSVVNWNKGSNAAVYLKTEDCFFVGHIIIVGDDRDGDGMICLSAPAQYASDGTIIHDSSSRENIYVTIPLRDVKYIRIDS